MLRPVCQHWLLAACLMLASGCAHLPHAVHEPTFFNPYPQLAKVAVAPFFNLSAEPTVDGRQFALAYYNELQLVPGFEVVPIGVVERKMEEYRLSLGSARDARKLAQLLEVDAVVVGAVTDFNPYYPPRCGLRVAWYAANPYFHTIQPGYGLPWGTPQEEEIPGELIFEAEFAAARQKMAGLAPAPPEALLLPLPTAPVAPSPAPELLPSPEANPLRKEATLMLKTASSDTSSATGTDGKSAAKTASSTAVAPPAPSAMTPVGMPPYRENDAPVMRHTQVYNGHDQQFTAKLKDYVCWRDDARFGGWDGYLRRSDDFIRFCCYLHISEMLSARGGADETRVVWHWGACR
jgi:hypothetical protein